jgi:hypothetical protein
MLETLLILLILSTLASAAASTWNALECRWLRQSRAVAVLMGWLLLAERGQAQPREGEKDFMGPIEKGVEKGREKGGIKRLHVPQDASVLALEDLKTIPFSEHVFIRYLFLADPSPERVKAVTVAINHISRADAAVRPIPLADGFLLRLDLRTIGPVLDDLKEYLELWESFQFDPTFSILLTHDAAERLVAEVESELLPLVPVKGKEGSFTQTPLDKIDLEEVDVVRFNAEVGPELAALQGMTQSLAPITEYRYFVFRGLSTIKDDGPFKTIYGGLYYELSGVKTAKQLKKKKGTTDLDVLLESLGVGDADKGIKFRDLLERLRSDQRVAMERSEVTGKPRRIDFLNTLAARGDVSFIAITNDVKDKSIDFKQHALQSLTTLKPDAFELIWRRKNGFDGYALVKAVDESLQDEVPPDIAVDTTIPAPYTRRLQSAISCIRCHEADGSDGWKPVRNDVRTIVERRKKDGVNPLDIFGPLELRKGQTPEDAVARLVGQYLGSPDKNLRRARDDYAEAVLRTTGPWERANRDQANVVEVVAQELGYEIYNGWWFKPVNAQGALRDLGFVVDKEVAVLLLNKMLEPGRKIQMFGALPEGVTVDALRSGLEVSRSDWNLEQSITAARINQALQQFRELGPMPKEKQ